MICPKPKPLRDPKYLAWLRTLPCAVCGRGPCEAAHQRLIGGGVASKPGDDCALSCCFDCHRVVEHGINGGVLTLWNTKSWLHFEDKHQLREHLQVLCVASYTKFKTGNLT